MRTKQRKGLRHFERHNSRAQDHHPGRQNFQIEQDFVGRVRRLLQARDVGNHGTAPRRDHRLAEVERRAVDFNGVGRSEYSPSLVHVRPRHHGRVMAIDGGNVRSQLPHPRHDGPKVHLKVHAGRQHDAILLGVLHVRDRLGGADHGLGGDAACAAGGGANWLGAIRLRRCQPLHHDETTKYVPTLRQSPPASFSLIKADLAPRLALCRLDTKPPAPAPITVSRSVRINEASQRETQIER